MTRNRAYLPFLAAATGIATFSAMDGLMKSAAIAAGVYSAMVLRSATGAALMFPLWKLTGGRWPQRPALKVHMLRSAVSAAMASTFFWGLVRTPMAEAIAISFIAPLIALYLAAVMLGEKIARKAILASVLGLAGVLVIAVARLDGVSRGPEAGWGIVAIVVSAVLYAWNLILQRQQAQVADPREIALFQTGFVTLILGLGAPWFLHIPPPPVLVDIFGSALLTVISLMLLSWGYARAEAQALLPVEYTAFVWAALLGWVMFGEAVTAATIAGVILILIGCWIAAPRNALGPTEQTAL